MQGGENLIRFFLGINSGRDFDIHIFLFFGIYSLYLKREIVFVSADSFTLQDVTGLDMTILLTFQKEKRRKYKRNNKDACLFFYHCFILGSEEAE